MEESDHQTPEGPKLRGHGIWSSFGSIEFISEELNSLPFALIYIMSLVHEHKMLV